MKGASNNELKYYIIWFIRNLPLLEVYLLLYDKVKNFINHKFFWFNKKRYPDYLIKLERTGVSSANTFWYDNESKSLNPLHVPKKHPNYLPLATFRLTLQNKDIPWKYNFNDYEDTESIHRWNWILILLSEENHQNNEIASWVSFQIEKWMEIYLPELQQNRFKNALHWCPYTVGERISNACIFFYLTGYRPSKNIIVGLGRQADFLFEHLEFQGSNTGNHVVNNARGLFLAGCFLCQPKWCEIALAIFKNEVTKHITKDGFFREGSSHYHFLYTRWLLELHYFAHKFENHNTKYFLETICAKMLQQCNFFLVNDEQGNQKIPLFGDISPDFPPEWLTNLTSCNLAMLSTTKKQEKTEMNLNGWSKLWKNADNIQSKRENNLLIEKNTHFPKSGWYRLDTDQQTLFSRADKCGIPDYVGHHHQDIFHFCLFFRGESILVDSGRETYEPKGNFSITATAHNSMLIDNLPPFPEKRRFLASSYYKKENRVTRTDNELSENIKIESDGFSRITPVTCVERKFRLFSNKLNIIDTFLGKKKHEVKTYFHWDSKIKIQRQPNNIFMIEKGLHKAKFEIESNSIKKISIFYGCDSPLGWMSTAYGEKIPAPTMEIVSIVSFPNKTNYSLEWL
jgi:hypothetical protein